MPGLEYMEGCRFQDDALLCCYGIDNPENPKCKAYSNPNIKQSHPIYHVDRWGPLHAAAAPYQREAPNRPCLFLYLACEILSRSPVKSNCVTSAPPRPALSPARSLITVTFVAAHCNAMHAINPCI
jgi:hypothetical protein